NFVLRIADTITDAKDFIKFRAACRGWNHPRSKAQPFAPWILRSVDVEVSGILEFISKDEIRLLRIPFSMPIGKRSLMIGCGESGHLLSIDRNDEQQVTPLLVNPMCCWEHTVAH
ncbi:hypothetical protein BAE44_0023548, partial [Dichanthelium oligosanthes]